MLPLPYIFTQAGCGNSYLGHCDTSLLVVVTGHETMTPIHFPALLEGLWVTGQAPASHLHAQLHSLFPIGTTIVCLLDSPLGYLHPSSYHIMTISRLDPSPNIASLP